MFKFHSTIYRSVSALSLLVFGLLLCQPLAAQSVTGYTVTTLANNISGARGVSVDAAGNVYTIGRDTGLVFKIAPNGAVTQIAALPNVGLAGYVGPRYDPFSNSLLRIGKISAG